MSFTLTQLMNFIEVVEWGNISKAASHLNIAQPALSRQIKALEEAVDAQLIHRQSWGVEVTEEGRQLFDHAMRIRKECEAAGESIKESQKEPSGTAYLGLPSAYSVTLVPRLLTHLKSRYPKINVRIVTAFSGTIYEWLLSGRLDLALLYHSDDRMSVKTDPLFEESLVVVGSATQFSEYAEVALADVVKETPIIAPWRPHILRLVTEQMFHDQGLRFDPAFEIDSMPCIKELVKKEVGVTFLPKSSVLRDVGEGSLSVAPLHPDVKLKVSLGLAPNRPSSRVSQIVAENLVQIIQELSVETRWVPT